MDIKNEQILKKGAEAILVKKDWMNRPALYKIRIKKNYRHPKLDKKIRKERTVSEARIMYNLLISSIPVPCLYEVDVENFYIVMEYIEGTRLKLILESSPQARDLDLENLFKEIGAHVARMHEMNVIHGDITTSNIIIEPRKNFNGTNFRFIDFGLAKYSQEIEEKAVDLHLFKRVITSTHNAYFDKAFIPFLEGYRSFHARKGNKSICEKIIHRIKEIETRGRYIEKEKRI
ncbi:MAG: Kae1-associated kinase Bud32 [Promethearchaeota archaeon]